MAADNGREAPSFGRIIRKRRMELGLTQEKLAERVGESVRQSDISRMERDYISLPRRERLEALATALEVTSGYLLMHSGWASEKDSDGPGYPVVRDERERLRESEESPVGGLDAGRATPPGSESGGDAGSKQIHRHAKHPDQLTRLSRASQDVLAANRELARAIQTLTDESRQGPREGNGMSPDVTSGDTRYEQLDELNKDLRTVIDKLSIRNDDLEAQTLDLIARAASADSARSQLSAVMNAVGDVVIVVDEEQAIVLWSQSFTELIGADARAVRFQNPAGYPLDGSDSPLARVARGESFTSRVLITTPQGEVQSYEAIGRPSGAISGHRLGVLTLRPSPASAGP